MHMRCFFVILLISAHSFFAGAQDSLPAKKYFKSYLTDTRDIIKAPLSWDKYDIATFTMVAGGTGFLMIYDEKIDDFILRNQNKGLNDFLNNVISPLGSGLYSVPLMGVLYLTGKAGGNVYDQRMALLGFKTFVLAAGEATVIKMAFQRHRPVDDTPPDSWQFDGPFKYFSDDGSFVSRHATTSFAMAAFFSEGYKSEKKWVPWVAYSLASLVTFSRVYDRQHWASDAFAGACLGFATGKIMFKLNKKYLNSVKH
jgi:membrane-associated phospholipid phosphatase